MRIIGITGSSGAGKSTISNILKNKYDAFVINADSVAKKLSIKGTNYIREIAEKFGKDILDEQGELKRKKLAQIIYTNAQKRKELNECTFKYIKKEIIEQIKKAEKINVNVVVIDAPLLFECNLNELCDNVIGVISQKDLQIERIVVRDNIDYEHAEKRIDAQESNEFYSNRCDEIIENNNDMTYVENCVDEIAEKYNITKRLQ